MLIPKLLRTKTFRTLWIGRFAAIFGNRFLDFAFPWLILEMTGSPLAAGIVLAIDQLAPIVLAIPAGVWIEKRKKKKIALTSEFVRVISITALIVLILTDHLTVVSVGAVILVMGVSGLFFGTSYNLFLIYSVGRDRLEEAYNLTEGADAIASAIGPAMAGIVFLNYGAEWALAVTGLGFVISFITIKVTTTKEPPITKPPMEVERKTKSILHAYYKEAAEGITYIFKTKFQRRFLYIEVILGLTAISSVLLITILAKQNLELNSSQAGMLLSAMGVGAIVGVIVLEMLHKYSWKFLLPGALLVSAFGALLLAVASNFLTALIGSFFLDAGLSVAFVVHASNQQINSPNRLLARINTARTTFDGGTRLLGRLYAGGLTQAFDVRLPLAFFVIILAMGASIAHRTEEPFIEPKELKSEINE